MTTPSIKFRCRPDRGSIEEIEGYAVNPGGWFGKLWLLQISVSNALNPFLIIEAESAQDAIDELADSEQFGHLIDADDVGEDTYLAGNDSHPVDLDHLHIQEAPGKVVYYVEWPAQDHDLSNAIEGALDEARNER